MQFIKRWFVAPVRVRILQEEDSVFIVQGSFHGEEWCDFMNINTLGYRFYTIEHARLTAENIYNNWWGTLAKKHKYKTENLVEKKLKYYAKQRENKLKTVWKKP